MLRNIIFDFDGVILDSMPVRDFGFREIFKEYDKRLVEALIEFNNVNGGLSRFVKIKYFYEELLNRTISNEKIDYLANEFSKIMRSELTKEKYLIKESLFFIEENYKNYNFHIASGSEHNELNFLCEKLGLKEYFWTINGSPTHKNDIVSKILKDNSYLKDETILIGDSINDYEAAKINDIKFYGYNNLDLEPKSDIYLNDFYSIK